MCARSRKTNVLAAVAGAIRIQVPQVTRCVKISRQFSVKCLFLGHDDWIRRGPDRLYLECFECGRETHGWTTDRTHRADRANATDIQAAPTRTRSDHSPTASDQSAARRSLQGIADADNMTIAA